MDARTLFLHFVGLYAPLYCERHTLQDYNPKGREPAVSRRPLPVEAPLNAWGIVTLSLNVVPQDILRHGNGCHCGAEEAGAALEFITWCARGRLADEKPVWLTSGLGQLTRSLVPPKTA